MSSLGPVIYDDRLRYVSPSQLERFDETCDGGCERKWWFRYHERLSEPQSASSKLGDQCHAQAEHYLKTGEDVLGDIMRAGLRFLPAPGPDLFVEQKYGSLIEHMPGGLYGPLDSPVSSAAVPLVLRIDLMFRRDHFVDDDGVITASDAPEVLDHKTTKQIDDIRDEDSGAVIRRGYAKKADELAATWQMTAYGMAALAKWTDATAVRLGHVYYQTKGPREATKRSMLVSADDIRQRWRESEALVERMKFVATTPNVKDVQPNYSACKAYGGCAFQSECPRDPRRVIESMFGGVRGVPDRKKVTSSEKSSCAALRQGVIDAPPTVVTTATTRGGSMGLLERVIAASSTPNKPSIALPASNPSVEEEKAKLIAEEHTPQAPIVASEPTSVIAATALSCPNSGGQRELQVDDIASKKYKCEGCGQTVKIKPAKMGDGKYYAKLPEHGITQAASAPAPLVAPTTPPPAAVLSVETVAHKPTEVKGDSPTERDIMILLDSREWSAGFPRFETYVDALNQELSKKFGAADVRCAPKDSPLSYGQGPGALAALVREKPPEPGTYELSSKSSLSMAVLDVLLPRCRVIEGGR